MYPNKSLPISFPWFLPSWISIAYDDAIIFIKSKETIRPSTEDDIWKVWCLAKGDYIWEFFYIRSICDIKKIPCSSRSLECWQNTDIMMFSEKWRRLHIYESIDFSKKIHTKVTNLSQRGFTEVPDKAYPLTLSQYSTEWSLPFIFDCIGARWVLGYVFVSHLDFVLEVVWSEFQTE